MGPPLLQPRGAYLPRRRLPAGAGAPLRRGRTGGGSAGLGSAGHGPAQSRGGGLPGGAAPRRPGPPLSYFRRQCGEGGGSVAHERPARPRWRSDHFFLPRVGVPVSSGRGELRPPRSGAPCRCPCPPLREPGPPREGQRTLPAPNLAPRPPRVPAALGPRGARPRKAHARRGWRRLRIGQGKGSPAGKCWGLGGVGGRGTPHPLAARPRLPSGAAARAPAPTRACLR